MSKIQEQKKIWVQLFQWVPKEEKKMEGIQAIILSWEKCTTN